MTSREPNRDAAEGHCPCAAKATGRVPTAAQNDGKGFMPVADKADTTVPDPSTESREGHPGHAAKASGEVPISALVDQLAELQVRRKFYIAATNKQTNAAKALVRRALGWRYDAEDGDRTGVNARAARIVAAAFAGKEQKPEDGDVYAALAFDLATIAIAIEPLTKARHEIEMQMKRTARKLPVYAWVKEVKGLGELGLAVIVAEAGDLAAYPKKGHLWKRLGLAPHEGKAYSTWRMKGGLSADEWVAAGYSPRRRAEVYAVVSEPLFRAQSCKAGPYRTVYDHRRERTAETNPDWTKAHSHMDGLRKMTKHVVRDLWHQWRAAA